MEKHSILKLASSTCALLSVAALSSAAPSTGLGPRGTILRGAQSRALFKQCSRDSPTPSGFWNPGPRDVAPLEASFAAFWRAQKKPRRAPALATCYRQYAGFTRGGKKMIYLNAFKSGDDPQWKARAVVVCDGGPSFFGAVYDVAARKWGEMSFNGP